MLKNITDYKVCSSNSAIKLMCTVVSFKDPKIIMFKMIPTQ